MSNAARNRALESAVMIRAVSRLVRPSSGATAVSGLLDDVDSGGAPLGGDPPAPSAADELMRSLRIVPLAELVSSLGTERPISFSASASASAMIGCRIGPGSQYRILAFFSFPGRCKPPISLGDYDTESSDLAYGIEGPNGGAGKLRYAAVIVDDCRQQPSGQNRKCGSSQALKF